MQLFVFRINRKVAQFSFYIYSLQSIEMYTKFKSAPSFSRKQFVYAHGNLFILIRYFTLWKNVSVLGGSNWGFLIIIVDKDNLAMKAKLSTRNRNNMETTL